MCSGSTGIHVQLQGIWKSYEDRAVLKNIDLKILQGEFVAIVGKSGCGKSTLLRLIAGLEKVDGGTIFIDGKQLKSLNKAARIMFQDGRLLPWKHVIANVGLGLAGNWKEKAVSALKSVGLEDRGRHWPATLSGGQKQRVALARALVHEPELLLLDEPLGALDALTRLEMQALIESLWNLRKITTLLVTHDVEEAVALADRVFIIEEGSVVLDVPINLPRPRQRASSGFAVFVEEILDHILKRNKDNDLQLAAEN
ncbi:ATP-binding cassette domain-containing protein [Bacillus sp. T33-2]|uniref:ATP-binding cassette domain-containing protein n=1 Tax=Bacillus sp. T33-2 TaxID=2054168 RepID=UPI000C78DE55|nr:ATP-binding cassette domain-containing protein [Bacillus sp. T33-2]PLR95244.1 aliphatic sulfonate ABC transporter ATP-binding protein [Bacillus sp. T33-2]